MQVPRPRQFAVGVVMLLSGCLSSGPLSDNPAFVRPGFVYTCENPMLIAPGEPNGDSYAEVFDRVLDVVDDTFEIAYSNLWDGRIVTVPRIAPGFEQPWKSGSPNGRERLLATLQTYRHRCYVQIRSAEPGGYQVQVIILKDLLDDPRPINTVSGAVFADAIPVDRKYEVVDETVPTDGDQRWINKGRDNSFEQILLKKIQRYPLQ